MRNALHLAGALGAVGFVQRESQFVIMRPTSLKQRTSIAPSSMAMAAPCAMCGFIGWQASPSSTRRPRLHSGSGSRSSKDHLVTSTVASISACTVGCQPWNASRISSLLLGSQRSFRSHCSTGTPVT